jgi:hypothetical protein
MHQTIRRSLSSASATVTSSTHARTRPRACGHVSPLGISTGLALQRPDLTEAGHLGADQTAGGDAKEKICSSSAVGGNPRSRHIDFRPEQPQDDRFTILVYDIVAGTGACRRFNHALSWIPIHNVPGNLWNRPRLAAVVKQQVRSLPALEGGDLGFSLRCARP